MTYVACLTFDFDVWSGFAARGMTTPTPISRGEFGLVGARRLVDLLGRKNIRSTWFVPGVVIDSHEADVSRIVVAGHEIAHHGYSHEVPAHLSPEREEGEMVRAIASIRRVAGRAPRGYRSPAWDLSPVTIDLLLKHGFDYDSSLMGDELHTLFRPPRRCHIRGRADPLRRDDTAHRNADFVVSRRSPPFRIPEDRRFPDARTPERQFGP